MVDQSPPQQHHIFKHWLPNDSNALHQFGTISNIEDHTNSTHGSNPYPPILHIRILKTIEPDSSGHNLTRVSLTLVKTFISIKNSHD
jgi:hypothetical protein